MWLTGTSQYALRAVLCVAEQRPGVLVRVGDIAAALRCPRNYLSKTLHALVQAGVLRSTRGRNGGFELADPPHRLVLARVIAPFEPVNARRCLLGRPECGGAHPCLVHAQWERVAGAVSDFFAHTTVADLLAGGSGPAFPLPGRRGRSTPTPAPRKPRRGRRPS